MAIKRVTVHLDADDLTVLREAARWAGVPLGRLLREAIHARAEHMRGVLGTTTPTPGDAARPRATSPDSQA
ncbi:ribbon-helix-helix domain-containing protein [Streptacidiphilus sp. MAP5-3]|jgi:hypothetical protein|uniref:ribbon-helix-helix domain-containing protein n=1 Tax=unclassified Streptacidiphilus TaxID=2643834 RepID=UPI0035176C26